MNTLLPARETRSAHSFWAVFTAAPSQSGSGSGLSFCTTQSYTLAQLVTEHTHAGFRSKRTQPRNSLYRKNSNLPLKHWWGSSLSEISGHLSELKLIGRKRKKTGTVRQASPPTAPHEGTKTSQNVSAKHDSRKLTDSFLRPTPTLYILALKSMWKLTFWQALEAKEFCFSQLQVPQLL